MAKAQKRTDSKTTTRIKLLKTLDKTSVFLAEKSGGR
jgi:hypothetical protein